MNNDNPPVRIEYDPANLLASLIGKLHLKTDADLSRALGVAAPVISKIRHRKTPVSASLLIRMCEATNLSIHDLRLLMGDRRNTFRIGDKQRKPRAPGSDALGADARKTADRPAAWASAARDAATRFAARTHRTVLILGLLAIGLLGLILVKPHSADQFKPLPPLADAYRAGATIAPAPPAPDVIGAAGSGVAAAAVADMRTGQQQAGGATSPQQKWVSRWLAKRYRVAGDAIHVLVSTAYQAAKELKLDPLLILAVIAIESRFNPLSESPVGAQGLMQVMSKIHQEKFQMHGGIEAALDPVSNIKVGARILKQYVAEGGSVEAGLKKYVGAAGLATDSGYGHKVLSEYGYLREVARGRQVPANVTAAAAPRALPKTVRNNAPAALLPTAKNEPQQHNNPAQPADQLAAVQPLQ